MMKKLLTAAALATSALVAIAPAEAVTIVRTTSGSVAFYTISDLEFDDNGDGSGSLTLNSGFRPVGTGTGGVGDFVITYQFNTPAGFLTASGNSASTMLSTDVDFGPVTSGLVIYGPVKLNGVAGVVENETGSVGNSIFRWPSGQLVSTITNPQTLELSGYQNGNGRISGEVSFMAGAVPEPATWALMALGFGLVGTSLRSRRRAVVSA